MAESAAAGNDKSELKRMLKVASSHPVHMAMAIGPDGKPIMRMDKIKNAKALEKMIRAESPSAKDVRFGSVSVDPDESTEATFMLNKPLSGGARKLAAFLKPAGISKVNIVTEDGTPADSASDDEAPAGAGGLGAGMGVGADLVAGGPPSGGPLSAGPMSGGPPAGAALASGAAAGAAMGNAAEDHQPCDMSVQQAQMIAEGRAKYAAKHGGPAPSPGAGLVAGQPGAQAAPGIAGHAVPDQHGHEDHGNGHAGDQLAAGDQAGEHGSGKAAGQVVKGKDAAAGPNSIAALSDADFARLMKAMQAELVHLHHPETGPIKAVPPGGSAAKAAPAANGAHAEKPKPVVKLSDADLAKLQELAKAGHFTLVPANAAPKAPDGKDAAGKDATGKDVAGKAMAGKAGAVSPHPGSAPGAESVVAKDAKHPGAAQTAGGIANAAHPDPAHPDSAKSGHAAGGKAPDKAGAAPDAATKAGAAVAPNGKAPVAEDGGAMTAAKMTKDLTALVKRVMAVVKQNPSQQAELSRLAIDAQGSIRANDLEAAAATMQVLMMSLGAAAEEVPAMGDVHSKVNQEWEAVRAHIEADLDNHKTEALKAGVDPKRVEEAHASARAAIAPALAGVQSQIDALKQAKNDADLAAIKTSSQNDLDKVAIHLNNDKLFNLVDVFSPFKPMRALGTIAQFASKIGKGLHLFK